MTKVYHHILISSFFVVFAFHVQGLSQTSQNPNARDESTMSKEERDRKMRERIKKFSGRVFGIEGVQVVANKAEDANKVNAAKPAFVALRTENNLQMFAGLVEVPIAKSVGRFAFIPSSGNMEYNYESEDGSIYSASNAYYKQQTIQMDGALRLDPLSFLDFRPYGEFGISIAYNILNYDGGIEPTLQAQGSGYRMKNEWASWGYFWGAGAAYYFSENVGLQFNVRGEYMYGFSTRIFKGILRTSSVQAGVGLNFRF